MRSSWHIRYDFPISLPGEPLQPLDPSFEQSFIRTRIYDELDDYLSNIQAQHGKFWISSDYGGCGKSTMLSYIARQLYKNLDTWRALPFYFSVPTKLGTTVQHTFIRNFLEQFSAIDQNLRDGAKIFDTLRSPEFAKILDGFQTFKSGIERLEASLADLNEDELRFRFFAVLNKVLSPWKRQGVFGKYILLIDEMDKLKPEDVLRFLSDGQKLFEQMYDMHGFVAFLSGHASWVERIRIGSEFSYYQGKIFRIDPFLNEEDVEKLVQSRLTQCIHMLPSDNPWTRDGIKKLRELTGGIPRRILYLAASVMNEAAQSRSPKIGSGLVEEVLVKEDHLRDIAIYLQSNYGTYIKLKEAIDNRVDHVLYVIYNMPHHEVLKTHDSDMGTRTTLLGIELSDEEWTNCVESLTQFGCMEDRGTTRGLARDIVSMFDKFGEHQAIIPKLIPTIVRSVGEIKPKATDLPAPDYEDVIDRVFKRSPRTWLTEGRIYDTFSDAVAIRSYAKIKFPRHPETAIRDIYKTSFSNYTVTYQDQLLELTENGISKFRRAPAGMTEKDRRFIEIQDESLINRYIELVIEPASYDPETITKLDELTEDLLGIICRLRGEAYEEGTLRKKQRFSLFKRLGLPKDLANHVDFYLRESQASRPTTSLIQELMRQILSGLVEIRLHPTQARVALGEGVRVRVSKRKGKPPQPGTPISETSEKTLPNRVPVGHKHLDRLLLGGIPEGYAVLLTAPSCDERDAIIKAFIISGAKQGEVTFYVTTRTSHLQDLAGAFQSSVTLLLCNPQAQATIKGMPNVTKLNGVENLNDISIVLTSALHKLDQTPRATRRFCTDIISDVLLQHHAVKTRIWLNALISELKANKFTTLAVLDSEIHPEQDARAAAGLFEGEVNIRKGANERLLRVEKMIDQEYLKNEVPLSEHRIQK